MNVLIIDGAEIHGHAKGEYNRTLCETAQAVLEDRGHCVAVSRVRDGYDVATEVKKISACDVMIFQFPVYWFHMPGGLKQYIDQVYMAGRGTLWLNDGRAQGGPYGSGGLMQDKKYMLSLTWNAPLDAFGDPEKLFEGREVDDAFFMFHKMQQFMGATALPTFSCHNVIANPEIETDCARLQDHFAQCF